MPHDANALIHKLAATYGLEVNNRLMAFVSAISSNIILNEREYCAKLCDALAKHTIAAQTGKFDSLENIMLRQVANLGHAECAIAIRNKSDDVHIFRFD